MSKRPKIKFTWFAYVEKYTGDARYSGTIVSIYYTLKNKVRYVIEVEPQGFQMIVSEKQIRRLNKKEPQ